MNNQLSSGVMKCHSITLQTGGSVRIVGLSCANVENVTNGFTLTGRTIYIVLLGVEQGSVEGLSSTPLPDDIKSLVVLGILH